MTARGPIIDISPALTPDIAVWPGDTPLSREVLCTIEGGASVTLSTITQGTTLTGSYVVAAGQNSLDLTVASFVAGTLRDLAGNVERQDSQAA
jgi:hypothetical protein